MKRVSSFSFLIWSIFLIFALFFIEINGLKNINFFTFLYLFTINFSLFFGEVLGERIIKGEYNTIIVSPKQLRIKYKFLDLYLLISSILGTIYLVVFVKLNSDFNNIMSIPAQIAGARYNFETNFPFYLKILKLILYSGIIIAGLMFHVKRKKRIFIYIPILLVLLEGLLSAGKSGLLFGLLLFICFRISTSEIIKLNKTKNNTFKYLLSISGVFIFVLVAQLLRLERELDQDILYSVFNRIIGYGINPLLAFNQWFIESSTQFPSLGKFTFAGIFDFFLSVPREDGIYQDRAYFLNGDETNVFTLFRSLISDFSIIGSIFFYFSLGIFYGLFRMLKLKYQSIQMKFTMIHLQATILCVIIWSVFGSFLAYNTFIFSIILSYIICMTANLRLHFS